MNQIPAPLFSAYTDILRSSLIYAKSLMLHNNKMVENVKKVTSLLDAVSGIPELIYNWNPEKEEIVRKRLAYFDAIWATDEGDFSLLKIYQKHVSPVR